MKDNSRVEVHGGRWGLVSSSKVHVSVSEQTKQDENTGCSVSGPSAGAKDRRGLLCTALHTKQSWDSSITCPLEEHCDVTAALLGT